MTYEKKKFAEFLKTQNDGLELTREWLLEHVEDGDLLVDYKGDPMALRATVSSIITRAYLSLLSWPDSKLLPEVSGWDTRNIIADQNIVTASYYKQVRFDHIVLLDIRVSIAWLKYLSTVHSAQVTPLHSKSLAFTFGPSAHSSLSLHVSHESVNFSPTISHIEPYTFSRSPCTFSLSNAFSSQFVTLPLTLLYPHNRQWYLMAAGSWSYGTGWARCAYWAQLSLWPWVQLVLLSPVQMPLNLSSSAISASFLTLRSLTGE